MACNQPFRRNDCVSSLGCPPGVCPDFTIKRHDVRPVFKVEIEDCDGPFDFTDLVVEVNMWAKAKLKVTVTSNSTFLSFADNIGFDQVMVGDILILDRARRPEHMRVLGFDESNHLVHVERGANGTGIDGWKKGTGLRIVKTMNAAALSEMILEDIPQLDGTTLREQLTRSFLVYEWKSKDTCLAGCYWLEFKVLKLTTTASDPDPDPSDTTLTLTPDSYGCKLGSGVEWVRRFPVSGEGYLIRVEDSPTAEL